MKLILILLIVFIHSVGFSQDNLPVSSENDYCISDSENKIFQRNLFSILINYRNQLLVNNKFMLLSELENDVETFMNNNGKDPELSDNIESCLFNIESRGPKTTDYEIIRIINNIYAKKYIEIDKRKICYLRGSEIKKTPPPPPPTDQIIIVDD